MIWCSKPLDHIMRGWERFGAAVLLVGELQNRVCSVRYKWTHSQQNGEHHWMLKRNCALSPKQLAYCFCGLGLLSFLVASFFASQGVWMVFPFTCLEVTVLGVAFFVYARHAADYEKIIFSPGRLVVERALGKGLDRVELEPAWLRVEYGGPQDSSVTLVAAGARLAVGRYVPAAQRVEFARELRETLVRRLPDMRQRKHED